MGLTALLRPLAAIWMALGGAAFLAALAAYALGEGGNAPGFLTAAATAGFAGGALYLATRGMPVRARAVEALGLALLTFLTAPVIAATPFLFDGGGQGWSAALFEATSALTTTGASLVAPEETGRAFIFWRCLLSWLGGYATLMLAAAVFAALEHDAPAIRRSALLTVDPDNVFSHLQLAATRIGSVYGALTAAVWLGLILTGSDLYPAICLALSSISTGGYVTASDGLGAVFSPLGIAVIAAGAAAGAMNVSLFWDSIRDRRVLADPDLAGLAALIVGLAAIFLLVAPGPGPLSQLADALFIVSTAGFSVAGAPVPAPAAALFAALIGGAAASTAGGVKISRILLLWRRLGAELAILADPASIVRVQHRGQAAPDAALVAVWAYVLAFAAVLGAASVGLAMTGLDFPAAFAAAGSALSNTGPLYARIDDGEGWAAMTPAAQLLLIPVMILGRLEVLAALAAIWSLINRR